VAGNRTRWFLSTLIDLLYSMWRVIKMRKLNHDDELVKAEIKKLQLFVADKLTNGKLSDLEAGQRLVTDIQIIHHIWIKDVDGI
jgi:hypothetical protein